MKNLNAVRRSLPISLLAAAAALGTGNVRALYAQENADLVISENASAAGITLDANRTCQINDGVTYSLTAPISGNFTLTKTGTGTLALQGIGNSAIVIQEGTVTLATQNSNARFANGVTVLSGATLQLAQKDSLGYEKTASGKSQQIYVYGGTLKKTGVNDNDTLGYVDIHLKGGTMTATTGYYDFLRPETRLFVEAADDASAENPTVSTLSARVNVRTNYMSETSGAVIDVAENAQLNMTGYFSGGNSTQKGLVKTGDGTLVLSGNTSSGTIVLRDGLTIFNSAGNGRRWNGRVFVEENAILRTQHDGLGYGTESGKTNLYLAGELNASESNETLRNVNLYLQGGKITGKPFHFLTANDDFRAMALDSANSANPTISSVESTLLFREHLKGNSNFTFTVDENAVLNLAGSITTQGLGSADSVGFHKDGEGKLLISNAGNSLGIFDIFVDLGSLEIQNDSLKTAKSVTFANGATLDQTAGTLTLQNLYFGGTDELILNADASTDYSTILGNVEFIPGANFTLSSNADFTFDEFMDTSIILMASDREFSGIENVSLELNDFSIDLPAGYSWAFNQINTDGKFLLTTGIQAPEPASWILLLSCLAGLYGLQIKRGRKKIAS